MREMISLCGKLSSYTVAHGFISISCGHSPSSWSPRYCVHRSLNLVPCADLNLVPCADLNLTLKLTLILG